MKRHAPATARNSGPLAQVLAQELPDQGLVLEVASGTGEHAVFMARRFPHLEWQPSDRDTSALASVDAWAQDAGLVNLLPAVELDAASAKWPVDRSDAVLCVNMVHISHWEATQRLFSGCARILAAEAPLILYGPYFEGGVETAPSNVAFDASLRRRDPDWGLRTLAAMDDLASSRGFRRTAKHRMPANNLTLVYRRA